MKYIKIVKYIKIMIMTVAMTLFLLSLLSLTLYYKEMDRILVELLILLIYILVCFVGGIMGAKVLSGHCIRLGVLIGLGYGVLLYVISWIFQSPGVYKLDQVVTTFVICTGSGMLGAIAAKNGEKRK